MSSHPDPNVERFSGYADCYDAFRPRPPLIIADLLTQLAGGGMPKLVVDLGSGTGLSTRIWAGRCERAVGVEPNPDMRAQAAATDLHISYMDGTSSETGLPDGYADIVTCSQSLHWMEPFSTFAESARILRPGGVFAAYDCDWPPTLDWQAEAAYDAFMTRVMALEEEHGIASRVRKWDKESHIQRMLESGLFRFVREVCVHGLESGGAKRLYGLALSQGGVESLLKLGLGEDEVGLSELRLELQRTLGDRVVPWYFSYRVRFGIL